MAKRIDMKADPIFRVEFVREDEDGDPTYDEVYVDGEYLGVVEQLLESDYLDALGISHRVIVTGGRMG